MIFVSLGFAGVSNSPETPLLTPEDVLGDEGLIARRMPHYESRPQQLAMARSVARAIAGQQHLVVEAGTGVGKSFAYLVPAILAATQSRRPDGERRRIVISTHTIALQEQLITKDIPFLNAILPVEFSAVLVKGRSNYISLRRMHGAWEKARSLFDNEPLDQLTRIRRWADKTGDGSLADLDFRPLTEVWDEVQSEHGNCLGKKCPTHADCLYYRARRRVWNADILVVNHAMFFSDLALRREGASVLPDYDVAIFDEAHTVEAVAGNHLGVSVTHAQLNYNFNKLYNDRTQRGLLLQYQLKQAQELVLRLRYLTSDLFDSIHHWREQFARSNGRVRQPLPIENNVSPELVELSRIIRNYSETLQRDEEKIELKAAADRLLGLAVALKTWFQQDMEDAVYWIESTGRDKSLKLTSAPIDVGPVLRDQLFAEVPTVILTSATLSVGQKDFSFFRGRIGLTQADELQQGSPFNFREQVRLVLADRMPDPSTEAFKYDEAIIPRIQKHVLETQGRAFVLFTSYRSLKQCADRLTRWFVQQNMTLLCQGDGTNRSLLLDRFKQEERAVLFGTESFWQGVDVPGDALQNVIITKLPFSVPDEPLIEARVERIKENGGNPFMEYQVPEAAIKLRQGFGRLIRTATDHGQVVILDPRIRTKRYGKLFLDSLPPCRVVIDRGDE
ncbi:MAG: helicase [Planctomycetota bacterium]|nr:MAG: helicase [Planctomycetota bacterium]